MNLPTILIGLLVLTAFFSIVARGVYNKKHGKGGCSCGGDCVGCCHCK
ncbi:FeoB-associated Cys-rich membrane protein [Oscillibacter hominis]|uniref:FeoB-associated Cys-rich membrane protein n=1 Tax=Oscillibacter hominis TaxID=2763056 RepID=A0A7G9B6P0_9FIRM|nr:FeoB-associated Cys-rich membrane protein [Oscillibacter hominis]QNL45221.1 FeoB-associated Cys-rich membrane protein [Oscillibacter hominis]